MKNMLFQSSISKCNTASLVLFTHMLCVFVPLRDDASEKLHLDFSSQRLVSKKQQCILYIHIRTESKRRQLLPNRGTEVI
jgi:hypothetical protein